MSALPELPDASRVAFAEKVRDAQEDELQRHNDYAAGFDEGTRRAQQVAVPQTAPMPPQSNLNDPRLTTILFSVLVKRLGGTVTVTQDDIDAVAYNRLEEEGREDGTIVFRFLERGRSS